MGFIGKVESENKKFQHPSLLHQNDSSLKQLRIGTANVYICIVMKRSPHSSI